MLNYILISFFLFISSFNTYAEGNQCSQKSLEFYNYDLQYVDTYGIIMVEVSGSGILNDSAETILAFYTNRHLNVDGSITLSPKKSSDLGCAITLPSGTSPSFKKQVGFSIVDLAFIANFGLPQSYATPGIDLKSGSIYPRKTINFANSNGDLLKEMNGTNTAAVSPLLVVPTQLTVGAVYLGNLNIPTRSFTGLFADVEQSEYALVLAGGCKESIPQQCDYYFVQIIMSDEKPESLKFTTKTVDFRKSTRDVFSTSSGNIEAAVLRN